MKRLDPLLSAQLIEVARGARPADLLLRNAKIVNVFTGRIEEGHLAIHGDRIVGWGDYTAREEIDLKGAYVSPGLIDSHMHVESSQVTPEEFARTVVPRGTTTVFVDPHEIANVIGKRGIEYMLDASENLPLDVMVMTSSCVPATHLETAGASLTAAEIAAWDEPRLRGLAEMMNFPGVIHGDPECLGKIRSTGARRVDGHAPRLSGLGLNAYIAAGIASDHECTVAAEAEEKLARGLHIFLREGSVTRDIEALLPVVNAYTLRRCHFCTDDREPIDLMREGHIDFCLRKAVGLGLDPVWAITMASMNAAEYFGIPFSGAVAPGFMADLVIFEDLREFKALRVMKRGRWAAENGQPLWQLERADDSCTRGTVRLPALSATDFEIVAGGTEVQTIELIPHQIVTGRSLNLARVEAGRAVADPVRDLLKLVVVERHSASGKIGLGFVKGFGLKRGAIASSVAHDSHNIVAAGASDADLLVAVRAIAEMQGGQVVVADGKVIASLALPIAGLMSDQSVEQVARDNEALIAATRSLGGTTDNPFMSLSFLALPVIPTLKLTDLGLVDVDMFEVIPLFV